jgi:polyphosphate kinase
VTDPVQRQRIIDEDLVAYLHDGVDAWDLLPDGTYARVKRISRHTPHSAQAALMVRYGGQDETEGD